MKNELEGKKKMVPSHALDSTFSLYSVLPPFRQPLRKAVLCLCSDETVHSGLAAKPRHGWLLTVEKTINCDLRKMSPKMEKPMPASDCMPPKHTKWKN